MSDKQAIVDWATRRPEIVEVWLYGSRARGDHKPGSDIDLAVVTVGNTPSESELSWFDFDDEDVPTLHHKPHLEWCHPEADLPRVGSAVRRDGILPYRRNQ